MVIIGLLGNFFLELAVLKPCQHGAGLKGQSDK